jgi:hypothetical protein
MKLPDTKVSGEQPQRPANVGRRSRGGPDGASLRDRVVIGTTVVGVVAFLVVGIPLLKRDAPIADTEIINPVVEPTVDADRQAVRGWLRHNVEDPHPREIRWWPARELVELHRARLEAARDSAADNPDDEEYLEQLEHDGPDRVCRLNYRTKNDVGAQVAHDDLFELRDGRVRVMPQDSARARASRRYFPDSDGTP